MTYATTADMTGRFDAKKLNQLTAGNSAGPLDTTVLALALVDAQAQMDQRIAARPYDLPITVTPTPPLLVDYNCDIAYYELHRKWMTPPPEVRRRRDNALAQLDLFQDAKTTLGLPEAAMQNSSAALIIRTQFTPNSASPNDRSALAPNRRYTDDSLKYF